MVDTPEEFVHPYLDMDEIAKESATRRGLRQDTDESHDDDEILQGILRGEE